MTRLRLAAAVVGLALGLASPAVSQDASDNVVSTVASFDSPAFLENLIVEPDGSIILTSYLDRTLRAVSASGQVTTVAALLAHPVGLLRHGGGFLVSAHGASFTEGPGFTSTNQVLLLDGQGRVVNTIAAPEARFLNGMVEIGPDAVLIADSIAGLIWRFTPSSGALTPWLSDERLTLDPQTQPFRPGANGLKLHNGRLFVSNSSRGTLHSVGLSASLEPEGELSLLAAPGPVDDFAFGPDDVLYGATHGETLIAVTPTGAVSNVMDEGCDSCTSVAVVGERLIVLTTGNLVEGGTGSARVLSVAIPR